MGRNWSRKVWGIISSFSKAKRSLFWEHWRFGGDSHKLEAVVLAFSSQQAIKIDPWRTEDRSLKIRSRKHRSLMNQGSILRPPKLKIVRLSHWNVFYFTQTRYKTSFRLCIIIHTDSNMYICTNNANLCWFGVQYLRNNNCWKMLS